MSESPKNPESIESLRESFYAKAEVLSNDPRAIFPFPGISEDQLHLLEEEEKDLPPGYFTPIRDIIAKCQEQGVRVYVIADPRNHEVFIIPAVDAFAQDDSLRLHYFESSSIEDGDLARLVVLAHSIKELKRAGMN